MRWRFLDRVTFLDPWRSAAGRKAVSLEEYLLLDPLGRRGAFPETLVIECCVELARWLVVVSSSFQRSAVLETVERFEFVRVASEGTVLDLSARVGDCGDSTLTVACEATRPAGVLARGRLALSLLPLAGEAREEMLSWWREVRGDA